MPTTARSAVNLPFNEAVDFFRQKVNVPTERWTDLMNEAHSHGFAVAGAANEAMLGDFREAVDRAISQGTGLAAFRQDFDAIVKKYGWQHTGDAGWRARVIYETNMTTAFSAGRYAQLTAPGMRAAFPYWQYNHTPCANPRLQHLAWDGLVLSADDGFWDTCYPPNGWGCRCFVTAVSAGGLGRMGKSAPDLAPVLQYRDWTNKSTGEVMKVPVGVDPGFVYNPGKAWAEDAKLPVRAPEVKLVGGKMPHLARPGANAVEPHVLDRFIAAPDGAAQVATLSPELVQLLGTKSPRVLLSAPTLTKQAVKHPEMTPQLYAELAAVLKHPELMLDAGERHIRVIGRVGTQVLSVMVKTTGAKDEVFVLSAHVADMPNVKRFLRKNPLLAGDASALLDWMGKRAR